LKPVDVVTGNTKRNPHRYLQTETCNIDKLRGDNAEDEKDGLKEEPQTNLKGGDIQCINQF